MSFGLFINLFTSVDIFKRYINRSK
jgi:hypothetical protein